MTKPNDPPKDFLPADDAARQRILDWAEQSNMAQWLGLEVMPDEDGFLYRLNYHGEHIGNQMLHVLHGGVISTFLQTCCYAETLGRSPDTIVPTVISVHCDFLRPAKGANMVGKVSVVQKGRRLAFMEAIGWQDDPAKPVGKAAVSVRLSSD